MPNFEVKGNRCIYCGKEKAKLTDEHIVPFSLGGNHVLLKSSCKQCQNIMSRFEGDVARGLWGEARDAYGAPSRNKKSSRIKAKKQADRTKVNLKPLESGQDSIQFPMKEFPAGLVFYEMGKAGILQGLPDDCDLSPQWQLKVVSDDARRDAFLAKHPGRLVLSFKHVPESFGRLLAKIGYGNILTVLNPDDFQPLALDYILGRKQNISYLVGSTEAMKGDVVGYRLRNMLTGYYDYMFIVVEIRLFANVFSPIYHAVSGVVQGASNVERVIKKMGSSALHVLPFGAPKTVESLSLIHI